MKNKILTFALASILLLSGCTQKNNDNNVDNQTGNTQTEEVVFTNVKGSSFIVGEDLLPVSQDTEIERKNVIDWYLDPFCPGCIKLESIMAPRKIEMVEDGKMYIRYNIMSFLSPKSVDDYSTRAAAFILGVVEYDPNYALKYMNTVMNEDFRPKTAEATPDSKFKDAYIELGGSEDVWTKVVEVHEQLKKQVTQSSSEAYNSMELIEKSPIGEIAVPYVLIGDSPMALDFTTAEDVEELIFNAYNEYKQKLIMNDTELQVLGSEVVYKVGDVATFVSNKEGSRYVWNILRNENEPAEVIPNDSKEVEYVITENDVDAVFSLSVYDDNQTVKYSTTFKLNILQDEVASENIENVNIENNSENEKK